jgi:hypothetical protein
MADDTIRDLADRLLTAVERAKLLTEELHTATAEADLPEALQASAVVLVDDADEPAERGRGVPRRAGRRGRRGRRVVHDLAPRPFRDRSMMISTTITATTALAVTRSSAALPTSRRSASATSADAPTTAEC